MRALSGSNPSLLPEIVGTSGSLPLYHLTSRSYDSARELQRYRKGLLHPEAVPLRRFLILPLFLSIATLCVADDRPCSVEAERRALRLINHARTENGLPLLRESPELARAAQEHSLRMAEDGEMSHAHWLLTLWRSGFTGRYRAQNIAWNQESADEVVEDWLSSAEHRRNILNPDFRFTAIECVRSEDGAVWWTEYLGG